MPHWLFTEPVFEPPLHGAAHLGHKGRSCYIGDIVENAEEVAALLDLPPYTMPLSMLIIGTPRKERPAIAHPVVNLVHEERYCRADAATMDAQVTEMDAMFRPHAREAGVSSQL